jgi:hypothetical protein
MSSYINDRRHFDSIAAGIKKLLQISRFCPSKKLSECIPVAAFRSPDSDMKPVDEIVARLADIQIISVCHQYPADCGIEADIADNRQIMSFPASGVKALSPVSLYKAIRCSLYQIEERRIEALRPLTVEETGCLTFFRTLLSELAEHIVERLPEYEKATWDITQ